MAISDIDIANRALTKLGVANIISFGDNNQQARTVSSIYAPVRDALMRRYLWNFTIKRASLPAMADVPAFDWARQFQLPSDCLRVLWAGEFYPGPDLSDMRNGQCKEYEVEGRVIMSNLPAPMKVRYASREIDPTKFDPMFVDAFACKLAVEMAETLTNSSTNRQMAWDEFRTALVEAISANAMEKPSDPIADETWMMSRWC